jgi:hypothetical protein
MMSRTPLRIAYVVVTVAAISAAVLSFNALADLAAHNGTPSHLAFLFPIVVDLTGVAATVSILAMKSAGHVEDRWFPWMVLGVSVSISLGERSSRGTVRHGRHWVGDGAAADAAAVDGTMRPVDRRRPDRRCRHPAPRPGRRIGSGGAFLSSRRCGVT